jgi:hypothetical protein
MKTVCILPLGIDFSAAVNAEYRDAVFVVPKGYKIISQDYPGNQQKGNCCLKIN